MSLLESLARAGEGALEEHGEEWLRKGVEAGRAFAVDHLDEQQDELAQDAFDVVEDYLPEIARLGRGKAVSFLHLVGLERMDEARTLWLTHGASFEERRRASAESTEATHRAAQQNEDDLEDLLEALQDLGSMALRVALPLLLGAL